MRAVVALPHSGYTTAADKMELIGGAIPEKTLLCAAGLGERPGLKLLHHTGNPDQVQPAIRSCNLA